jgi:hypothetical protein
MTRQIYARAMAQHLAEKVTELRIRDSGTRLSWPGIPPPRHRASQRHRASLPRGPGRIGVEHFIMLIRPAKTTELAKG